MYTTMYAQCQRSLADQDQGDDLWDYVKTQSGLYESEIAWKEAVTLYDCLTTNHVKPNGDDCGTEVTVLHAMSELYGTAVDVLAVQPQEKSRNLLRYIADLASKILPARHDILRSRW